MSRLSDAIDQIRSVRDYTVDLLAHVDESDWFRQPTEGVTHIAWQVGHLAMAEYRLALQRTRGVQPVDEQLISSDLLGLFGKGSIPDADPAKYPSPSEIRAVLDRVHAQMLAELPHVTDASLDEPAGAAHPRFSTKLGALRWLPQHELVHVGQIALPRRLFGEAPLR